MTTVLSFVVGLASLRYQESLLQEELQQSNYTPVLSSSKMNNTIYTFVSRRKFTTCLVLYVYCIRLYGTGVGPIGNLAGSC